MAERRSNRGPRGQQDCDTSDTYPPFSRLFIICSKYHTESDVRDNFSKYGTIKDIWIVKDRASGENKGVAYVQFSKTSEAATALEDMHGKTLGNETRPIRVMVAASKYQGQVRDNSTDEDKYVRLFVMIPKTMNDSELNEEFSKYGNVESTTIVRDKETRENKGIAYVKYKLFSEAAKAFENTDRKYKAIFAEPKKNKSAYEMNHSEAFSRKSSRHNSNGSFSPHMSTNTEAFTTLNVVCSPQCQQGQIRKLFDLVPGLDYCQYKIDNLRQVGIAQVSYTSHQSAKYACDKLHGFEYPPGLKLVVKPDLEMNHSFSRSQSPPDLSSFASNLNVPGVQSSEWAHIVETISKASSLLQAAAAGTLANRSNISDDSFCNVNLPQSRPLASIDAPVAQRWFLVCQPQPPPIANLRDAFARFGDLIDVYTLPNKNVGYVKYASVRSAQEARKILHGAEICGIRIKVIEAEEPRHKPAYLTSAGGSRDNSPMNSEHYDDRCKRMKIDGIQDNASMD